MTRNEEQARAVVQSMLECDPRAGEYMTADKIARMAEVLSRRPSVYRKGVSRVPASGALFTHMPTGTRRIHPLREMVRDSDHVTL